MDLAPELYVALGRLVRSLRREVPSGALGAASVGALTQLSLSGAMRASALADAEGMTPAGMTRVLNRLDEEALIRREPDPTDGRAQLISLTDAGAAFIAEGREAKIAVLRRRLEGLSPDERARVEALVPVLERLGEQGSVSEP